MTDAALGRQQTRTEDERASVLRAAYRLIAANPDRPITLKELLEESGLSTRAFYRHFDTKDDLLLAIYRSDASRVETELRQRVAAADSPHAAVVAWVEFWVSVAFDVRRSRRVNVLTTPQFAAVEGVRRAVAESYLPSMDILRLALEDGRVQGVFPRVDPSADARSLQMIALDLVGPQAAGRRVAGPIESRRHLLGVAGRLCGAPLQGGAG